MGKKKEKIVAHTVKNSRGDRFEPIVLFPVENLQIIHPSILVNQLVTGPHHPSHKFLDQNVKNKRPRGSWLNASF